MMTSSGIRHASMRQRGVVLITGLIFLVVLTMIVLSVMRGSTLEERMAANARNRQLALQAAEAVSRDAAATLFACPNPTSAACSTRVSPIDPYDKEAFTAACTDGFCSAPDWKAIDWTDPDVTRTFASPASNLSGVTAQPRYIVEPVEGGAMMVLPASEGAPCPPVLFRVIARGVGADSSIVFVESMYRYQPRRRVDSHCG